MPTTISGTSITTASIDLTAPLSVADGGTGALVAFSATGTATTALPAGGWTKCLYATEEFDTNNNYDTSTSRFTPTVAGYYQVSTTQMIQSVSIGVLVGLYKNGTLFKQSGNGIGTTNILGTASLSTLIYMNGSTDYVESWVFAGGATTLSGASAAQYFQAILVRAA